MRRYAGSCNQDSSEGLRPMLILKDIKIYRGPYFPKSFSFKSTHSSNNAFFLACFQLLNLSLALTTRT